jgi:hypothetical protein
MAVWAWVLIAVGAAIALSTIVGLALARILGRIGDEVAELLELEPWASASLTRSRAKTSAPTAGTASPRRRGGKLTRNPR